jgi:hypothetical protein
MPIALPENVIERIMIARFMIKVRYSARRHLLLIDFCNLEEECPVDQWKDAVRKISRALSKLSAGYTLIEVFRQNSNMDKKTIRRLGAIIDLCYAPIRIWRVLQLSHKGGVDPGLRILHRTRWKRNVPALEVSDIKHALSLAEEEISDNRDWLHHEKEHEATIGGGDCLTSFEKG